MLRHIDELEGLSPTRCAVASPAEPHNVCHSHVVSLSTKHKVLSVRGVTLVAFELLPPAFELFVWEIFQVKNYRMGTSRPPIESP